MLFLALRDVSYWAFLLLSASYQSKFSQDENMLSLPIKAGIQL